MWYDANEPMPGKTMNRPRGISTPLLALSTVIFACAASANPNFVTPSQAQYRMQYANASAIYKTEQIDYTTFIDMLMEAWLYGHRADAQRDEDIWEIPTANDWIGCVLSEFPKPDVFERVGFHSYTRSKGLPEWIAEHQNEAINVEGGRDLVERLEALSDWSAHCEDLVRGDNGTSI